jgi:hypothetical protein
MFKFEDVNLFDDMQIISEDDINLTSHRYKLLQKKAEFNVAKITVNEENQGSMKDTSVRVRSINVDSHYDPYHDKIQNALCGLLREKYKHIYNKVDIEKGRVDVKALTYTGDWHYFEIKTTNLKLSIRLAIGQLMEYSYWPDIEKAAKLYIVADREPNEESKKYLSHIRTKFNLPIYYRCFDLLHNSLSDEF